MQSCVIYADSGCVLFDWPDPVGPGLAVLFRRPQAKQPTKPGPAIQKNAASNSRTSS